MQNNLNIHGEPIQTVYDLYKQGKYIVNRRYQRKLVWTLEEKKKFIDSLLKQYPVPLFLGVVFEHPDKGKCFEILDGMQRLEAITSFIEGRFNVEGEYFDLSVIAGTKRLLDDKKLVQREPKLDFNKCNILLNYQLPISSSSHTSSESVDETFRRINTGGVRLSRQEVRQAGVVSDFSQLVRKCAMYIRGDVSHSEIVDLENMRPISLTRKDLDYGINIEETFWNKNHIITTQNILASRDEELVAHVLLNILLGSKSKTTADFLDQVYTDGTEENNKVEDAIRKFGFDIEVLYEKFYYVYDELATVVKEFDKTYPKHIYKDRPIKIQNSYQVLFLAFHHLLLVKNMKIQNYKELAKAMQGIATDCMGRLNENTKWDNNQREKMVKAVVGVIDSHFIAREGIDPTSQSWMKNLENILNQSRTENICYDFKIGLYPLSGAGIYNEKLISKIVKTLTAMANSHAGENYIIIGVADNEQDALKHEEKYGYKAKVYNGFYISGIGSEAKTNKLNIDTYQQKLQQCIEKEPISDQAKRLILRNIVFSKYYDKDVVMMKIIRGDEPIEYDKEIYVRKIANTDPNPVNDKFAFYKEFMAQSKRLPYS